MSALEGDWRRLGAVLVEAGLISEEDLFVALAAQEGSARPLGEILVARGLVSSAAVANALAEQRGSFFRSEHGFGTGLRSSIDQDSGSGGETSEPETPPLSDWQTPTAAERQQAAATTTPPASTDARERDTFEPSYSHAAASADQESADAVEAAAPAQLEGEHLLFVPTPHGYLFLEKSGAAPKIGEVLDLLEVPSIRLVVAKLTSSPLPHDRRVCAYLQPL